MFLLDPRLYLTWAGIEAVARGCVEGIGNYLFFLGVTGRRLGWRLSVVGCLLSEARIAVIENEDDIAFVAEVPELAGCIAQRFHARGGARQRTGGDLLWIETAKEFGDPISEPMGGRRFSEGVPGL